MTFSAYKRVLLLASLLVTFAAPTDASAEPFTPELEADYQQALIAWGVSAPPQCSVVERTILVAPDPFGEGAAGRTSHPGPSEANVECRITLYEPALRQQFGPGCPRREMMRHEVGHLLGHGHTEDPHDIMSAVGLHTACPDPLEALRWRRIERLTRCEAIDPGTMASKRCWAKSRRLTKAVRAMVRRQDENSS